MKIYNIILFLALIPNFFYRLPRLKCEFFPQNFFSFDVVICTKSHVDLFVHPGSQVWTWSTQNPCKKLPWSILWKVKNLQGRLGPKPPPPLELLADARFYIMSIISLNFGSKEKTMSKFLSDTRSKNFTKYFCVFFCFWTF